jgi:hypothetical protein
MAARVALRESVEDMGRQPLQIVDPELVHHLDEPPFPRRVAGGERVDVAHGLVGRAHIGADHLDQERLDLPRSANLVIGINRPSSKTSRPSGPKPRPPISTTWAVQAK